MGADRDCMHTKFGGAQSRDRDFRGQKLAKKWTILNRFISATTDINKKKFALFDHATRDVFRGGIVPWPPFGSPELQNCIRK